MNITAIVLEYLEPGWTERTEKCVINAEIKMKLAYVGREGVGSMSDAFNRGWVKVDTEYVWFLTNVGFTPDMPKVLLGLMERFPNCAGIHPAHRSDHFHLRKNGPYISTVPFIEWTAPFIRMSALEDVGGTDEQMPYWGFDLDWSHRAKERGWDVMVSREFELDHEYLVSCCDRHPISKKREARRRRFDVSTEKRLREKWGTDWMKKLWPTNSRAKGSGKIYV